MKKDTVIKKDMTIAQILNKDENVAPILMGFGMHCFGCPMSRMETLAEACAAHGLDIEIVLDKLNNYFKKK